MKIHTGLTAHSLEYSRGQSLVEFAFSMVILLILLSGIFDGGRAIFTWMALRDGAQEGALYGSTNPTDTAGVQLRVRNSSNMLQDLSNDVNAITSVQVTVATACMGNAITVRVAYDNFPIVMPFIGTFIGSQTVPISASITDTILRPPCQ